MHKLMGVVVRDINDVEPLLDAYDENLEVEPYLYATRDEAIKESGCTFTKEDNILDHLKEYYGEDNVDSNGDIYNSYNEKGYWDWYEIGGRWSQHLLVKDTVEDCGIVQGSLSFMVDQSIKEAPKGYKWVDYALIKDIEFDKMEELCTYNFADNTSHYRDEYKQEVLKAYGSEEQYNKEIKQFTLFGLVSWRDNNWVENDWFNPAGDREWAKKCQSLLAEQNPNDYLVVVDCHE